MKSLKTLIKLHKQTLDTLRRDMVALENEQAQMEQAIDRLEQQLGEEGQLAGESTELQRYFGDYATRIKKRQEVLQAEIHRIEGAIEELRAEITEEFGELKKYEIALQNAIKRHQEEERHKETLALNEVAAQQHRNKADNKN